MKLSKEDFSSIPIWVKFYNVPLELWSDDGLSYVASVIGKPLFLDEYTQKKSRLTFARICIEIPVDKDIPKSFKLNLGYGDPFEVKVEVPWSPKRCQDCRIFGHTVKTCPLKPKLEAKSNKQEWKAKEQKVEDEWQEVKKCKDKSSPSLKDKNTGECSQGKGEAEPREKPEGKPQLSSNPFDILQAYQDEASAKDEENDDLQELEEDSKSGKEEPKQKTTTPSPLQTLHKKQLPAKTKKK